MAKLKAALLLSAATIVSPLFMSSQAQDASSQEETRKLDTVVVTGTNIVGARINEALPVTVVSSEDIVSLGGVDGSDIVSSLPAQGATAFRDDNTSTVNNARGDVSSINLRSIGSSGTLVLLNGRRMIPHPGTQAELSTPVVTTNVNALPVANISRVEVLNDGASAIYGTDAVAGVFNTILKDDYEGLEVSVRAGSDFDTGLADRTFGIQAGKNFNGGKTNLNVAAEFSVRDGLFANEQAFSASDDLTPFLEGGYFEGDASFNNNSTRSPWGQFTLRTTSATRVRQNGSTLTSSSGVFHIQPATADGCVGTTATDLATPGICLDDGSLNSEFRYDGGPTRQIISDRDRLNVFAFLNHDLDNGLRLYGELGYYMAETNSVLDPITPISSGDISIPANNYWNPFGPITFSDGSVNPNRLPGLTNVPAEGLPVYVDGARFRLVDVGPRQVNVTNDSWRLLGGVKGPFMDTGWDFDSAVLYSAASTDDWTSNRVSSTLFQQALANETPNAYNMFNGGSLTNPNSGDDTLNDPSIIAPFLIDVQRYSETELALADFKITNADIYELPAGSIGLALGVEARYESYLEDRDPRLDGTITFTDMVTGEVIGSDAMGSSPTPDSSGDRSVLAGFAEASIPLVSPEMNIPLVNTIDVQLAARYEEYSDVGGSGLKPRVAAAWKPFDFLKVRGAWSEGFRAPNLYVINESVFRSNTREDALYCHVGVLNGTFADYGDCNGYTESTEERRQGAPDIGPEDDTNTTFGIVFEPRDLSGPLSFLNNFTATVDRWEIQRENVVGVFGGTNHISLDLVQALAGSSNPNVVRAAPNVDEVAFFAGTGISPVGRILYIEDTYDNNEDITVSGTDFAVYYRLNDTGFGDFSFKFNATRLEEYFIGLSQGSQLIADAVESGAISNEISVSQEGDIIEQDGQPKWRMGGSMSWRHDSGLGAGFRVDYVGNYIDTGAGLNPDDLPFIVEEWTTGNVYVQYEIDESYGPLSDMRFRVGVNNVTDEAPPLADESNGYDGAYHSARGRYYYMDISKKF